jgi:hypothetical protein
MLPYVKEYEPPRRRLRIRNKKRLIVSLILIVLTFLVIIIPHQGTNQVNYKPYRVAYGDTYWQIAKQLQEEGYRPRADIRDIVHELIQKSGIKAHELREGDIIYLPDFEG